MHMHATACFHLLWSGVCGAWLTEAWCDTFGVDVSVVGSHYHWQRDRITGNIVSWFINDSKLPEQTLHARSVCRLVKMIKLWQTVLLPPHHIFMCLRVIKLFVLFVFPVRRAGKKRCYGFELCNTHKSPEGGRSLSRHNLDIVFSPTVKSDEYAI